MKKIWQIAAIMLCSFVLLGGMPVQASDSTTAAVQKEADNSKKTAGWKTKNGKTYYYNNGVKQTGWQKIEKKTYYFDKKGVMQKGFKTISKKKYYFDNKGVMQTGFTKIKGKTYYFDKKGVMQTGWKTINRKKYYFDKKGIMQIGLKTVGGRKYYFSSKGVMQTGFTRIKGKTYYFDKKGVMQKGFKTISRKTYYFDKNGVMQTGWKTIGGKRYYFDKKGVQAKNKTVKMGNKYCNFDKKGIYVPEKSYGVVNGVKVHVQYFDDPQVSAEELLAAILYSEAGNQKQYPVKGTLNGKNITVYKGQLGVGYVIANRMTGAKGIKEVIYQTGQFEPARTGVLTKYLKNYSMVSADCKNAAKIIMHDLNRKTNSVPEFKRSDFRWQNFWALYYARKTSFFEVYNENEYEILQGHVFFNYTKAVH